MSTSDEHTLTVPGTTPEQTTQVRRLAPVFGALATLASFLPSVPYNASGKKNRVQIRVALVVIGLLLVLASDRNIFLIILGFVLMASASVLPLTQLKKRDVINAIKSLKTQTHTTHHPITLKHDGRRLELWRGDKMTRRVLTNRAFYLQKRQRNNQLWVGVWPKDSKKKRDAIWFAFDNNAQKMGELERFDMQRTDLPVTLSTDDASHLIARLEQAYQQHQ